jgi:hypothetical protein
MTVEPQAASLIGGVLDDPFHPAGAVHRRDIGGVLQPFAFPIPDQCKYHAAKDILAAAELDIGAVPGEGDRVDVIAIKWAIAVAVAVVADESVSLHGVNGGLERRQIDAILSSGESGGWHRGQHQRQQRVAPVS